ncbi:MAG: hypothetical protein L0K86_28220 [Actinomycetia bacterium]|nr:hypothetical protein [Actinomycetes bacterium]
MVTSLRVSDNTRRRAATLAADESRSIGDVVDRALDAYETAKFWEQTRLALANTSDDDDSWDATVRDGLMSE